MITEEFKKELESRIAEIKKGYECPFNYYSMESYDQGQYVAYERLLDFLEKQKE